MKEKTFNVPLTRKETIVLLNQVNSFLEKLKLNENAYYWNRMDIQKLIVKLETLKLLHDKEL